MSGSGNEEEGGLHGSQCVANCCRPDLIGQFFMDFDCLSSDCSVRGFMYSSLE